MSNFILFREISTKILVKYYREIILKVMKFWFIVQWSKLLELLSSNEPSWALISTHKRSLAFVSIHEYGAMATSVLMSTNECPSPPAHDCSWALMSAPCSMAPSSWVFMAANEYSWLLMSVHGCSYLGAYECTWVLTGAHECSWLYISSYEQP